MKTTLYPTLEEALELHHHLLQRFGGKGGVRDLGLLQSALGRPQTGYYQSLSLQAAALMQSLAQNHSFVDGNKRVSFALTAIFLRMNGYRLVVEPDNGEEFLIEQVIRGKVDIETIARWIEAHIRPVKG
ncbi:MAG: type II toxin-antitoxin system death-on-curing family toxin [Bdellovibrionaceae bacterium]|nr:type II toxin-antitoxin system death-on-curing family toxin [Bdellovibrionales bacterium]MCB9084551.1 type II toxin-antitoxin system death-on-curing family toxin [Pseudobdellovibrionaceae bacterium]